MLQLGGIASKFRHKIRNFDILTCDDLWNNKIDEGSPLVKCFWKENPLSEKESMNGKSQKALRNWIPLKINLSKMWKDQKRDVFLNCHQNLCQEKVYSGYSSVQFHNGWIVVLLSWCQSMVPPSAWAKPQSCAYIIQDYDVSTSRHSIINYLRPTTCFKNNCSSHFKHRFKSTHRSNRLNHKNISSRHSLHVSPITLKYLLEIMSFGVVPWNWMKIKICINYCPLPPS